MKIFKRGLASNPSSQAPPLLIGVFFEFSFKFIYFFKFEVLFGLCLAVSRFCLMGLTYFLIISRFWSFLQIFISRFFYPSFWCSFLIHAWSGFSSAIGFLVSGLSSSFSSDTCFKVLILFYFFVEAGFLLCTFSGCGSTSSGFAFCFRSLRLKQAPFCFRFAFLSYYDLVRRFGSSIHIFLSRLLNHAPYSLCIK